jgi:hypothetical protein
MWETEVGGPWFQANPGQKEKKKFARSQLNRKKVSVVARAYHPSDGGKLKIRGWC